MNQFVDWLSSGGAMGNYQRKQDEMRQKSLADQLAQLQLKQAQVGLGPQTKVITGPNGQLIEVKSDASGRVLSANPLGAQRQVAGTMPLPQGQQGPPRPVMGEMQAPAWNRPTAKPQKLTPAQESLARFLPPELDPFEATTKDWVMARQAMEEEKNRPQQMTPYQEAQMARWQADDAREQQAMAQKEQSVEQEKVAASEFAGETLELVKDMLNPNGVGAGLEGSVGSIQGAIPSVMDQSVDFDNAHETLVSRLTKENLGIMKGVLSDTDIKILQNIGAGRLKLRGSEETYRKELLRIGEKMLMATGVTEADIKETMRANNMTRDEVLEALLGS